MSRSALQIAGTGSANHHCLRLSPGYVHYSSIHAGPFAGTQRAPPRHCPPGVPSHGVTAAPLSVGPRSDLESHPQNVPGIVWRAADLRLTPLLPEVFRTHLLIGLETSGGKHYRAGSDLLSSFRGLEDHPRHRAVLVLDEIHHRALVADLDPTLCSALRVLFHQSPAAIDRSQNEPAPETPLAVHLERLTIIHQAETQPFFAQPSNSLPGIVYQNICKGPVALAFRHPYH